MPPTASLQPLGNEITPELSAVEASLATIRPRELPGLKERVKSNVLLEAARLAETEIVPLSREKLIETIVKSGEPEITLSLQEYVKTVRTSYVAQGILIGLVLGFFVGVFGTVWLHSLSRPENFEQVLLKKVGEEMQRTLRNGE